MLANKAGRVFPGLKNMVVHPLGKTRPSAVRGTRHYAVTAKPRRRPPGGLFWLPWGVNQHATADGQGKGWLGGPNRRGRRDAVRGNRETSGNP